MPARSTRLDAGSSREGSTAREAASGDVLDRGSQHARRLFDLAPLSSAIQLGPSRGPVRGPVADWVDRLLAVTRRDGDVARKGPVEALDAVAAKLAELANQ
jgi:hypothetical protein